MASAANTALADRADEISASEPLTGRPPFQHEALTEAWETPYHAMGR